MRSPPKPKSRFLKLLRRTAATTTKGGSRGVGDENAVWVAHERASAAAHVVVEATQRVGAQLAKQRGAADSAVDQAKGFGPRVQEVERAATRTIDVLERLSVVALNASLEAVRMGEGPGRPLALVSDEVRTHAERGADGARLLVQAVRDLSSEVGSIAARVDDARNPAVEIAAETSRAQAAAGDVERALADMRERLRAATGNDPDTVRAMSDASEHAKALVAALGKLSGRVPRALLVGALSPLFDPLMRAMDEELEGEAE